MRTFSDKITDFLIRNEAIKKQDEDIYAYGLEILAENIGMTIMLLVVGVIINYGIETLIFVVVFCSLRNFCGGYHAKTRKGCHIVTFSVYIVFIGILIILQEKNVNVQVLFALYMLCATTIALFAPVAHSNNTLTYAIKRMNRRRAIMEVGILGIAIWTAVPGTPRVSRAILLTMIEVSLLIHIGAMVKMNEKNI